MQKTLVAATVAALVGVGGTAYAADVYAPGSLKDAPILVTPQTAWTGFYLGLGIGGGSVNHDLKATGATSGDIGSITSGDGDYYSKTTTYSYDGSASGSLNGLGGDGIFGAVQVGYDRQLDSHFVIGGFFDYDFADISSSASGALSGDVTSTTCTTKGKNNPTTTCDDPVTIGSGSGSASGTIKLTDMWTVGGRVGYLVQPTTLAYFLAGYSEAGFDLPRGFKSDTFSGWTVGGGLETQLTGNWFLKGEYRFTQLGKQTILNVSDDTSSAKITDEPTIQSARVSLVYKIGHVADPLK